MNGATWLVFLFIPFAQSHVLRYIDLESKFIFSTSEDIPPYVIPEVSKDVPQSPQQIHLSFTDNSDQSIVTWSTMVSMCSNADVQSSNKSIITVNGTESKFVDSGKAKHTQYIHRVNLGKVNSNGTLIYRIGCGSYKSKWFTAKVTVSKQPMYAVFGDMGTVNAQSLPRLLNDTKQHLYDAILHVGDFAYDMADNNGTNGDTFMQMVQPIASILPYMTSVGNHEEKYNFSHYKNRFSMPGRQSEDMFYSWNHGLTHFISISTEYYFYINYGIEQILRQYLWLEQDLVLANKNRASQPWIVVMGHRPPYCSNSDGEDCTLGAIWLRDGIPPFQTFGLDKLLHKYGVDLAIWAHEHSYERTFPVYGNKVCNGTKSAYVNPCATVHLITGSAGCKERHDLFGPPQPFSAFRSADYGYSRLQILNSTTLYVEQVSDDKKGQVIDRMVLQRDNHTPF